jgi:tetratricopeptide (TPR) repeat protein
MAGWLRSLPLRGTAGVLGLAVLLSARCVLAEPHDAKASPAPEAGAADTEQTVKTLMHRGVAEYRKGRLEAARAAFARAFDLKQHAAIAATLAEVETKLEHYRPAAEHWSFYLEHLPPERENERNDVETALADCRRHLGTISVEVDAASARVTLDGARIAPSPVEKIWVEPGEHTLAAESERGADRILISVAAGESKTAVLHTVTPPSSYPAQPVPSATPKSTDAAQGSTSELQRREKAGTGARTAVLIAGGAAAAAAALVGTTFTVLSLRAGNSADEINRQLDEAAAEHMLPASDICALVMPPVGCSELVKKQTEQERYRKVAIGSFVTAGGLAALTAGAYFFWPSSRGTIGTRPRRWALAPWFSATGAGIELSLWDDWSAP